MNKAHDIIESWQANAEAWVATIDNNELESRRLVTNDAIINAVIHHSPKRILDLGCGEGWLTRTLRSKGLHAWGTDAVQHLVNTAIEKDGEFYLRHSYEEIIAGTHDLPSPFDAIVINFALLDKEVTEGLLRSLPSLMQGGGYVFIQTLHPFSAASSANYASGWKDGSWNGMKRNFVMPYQWYFRTFEHWIKLFIQSGYSLKELKEPVHPHTGKPISVIFVLQLQKPFSLP